YGNYRGQYNHETVPINNEVFFDTLDINHAFAHVQIDHVDNFFDPVEPDADADPPVVPDPPKYFYWDPLDLNDYVDECIRTVRIFHRTQWRYKPPDLEILRPYLNFAPADLVAKTLEVTTQWGRHVAQDTYRRVFHSPFPAANVSRRREPVATDTCFADVPAVNYGSLMIQLYFESRPKYS
ncbi:MAG: hypothetical protein AAFU51_18900, partial [Bacteroidota bacterium]